MSEYYLKRTSRYLYTVAKFNDTTSPVRVYIVEFYPNGSKKAKCNCFNKVNCLHIRMVDKWYHQGCPLGGFFYWPATEDFDEEISFFSFPHGDGLYFDQRGRLSD